MPEKDDLHSILSELKQVLSDLKKEEKTEEEKQKQKVSEPEQPKSVQKQAIPIARPVHRRTLIQPVQPKPAPKVVPQAPAPVPSPNPPTQVHATVPQAPPTPSPTPVSVSLPPVPKQKPESKPSAPAAEVISENILKYACFYPPAQEKSKETFISNLTDVIKKTSKKPLEPRCVFELSMVPLDADWNDLINKCKDKKLDAVFLVHSQDYDSKEIKSKFASIGIFFQGILLSHLNRKITYVDLVVELILSKK